MDKLMNILLQTLKTGHNHAYKVMVAYNDDHICSLLTVPDILLNKSMKWNYSINQWSILQHYRISINMNVQT